MKSAQTYCGGTEEETRLNANSEQVIGAGLEIHKSLGPGLLESVYETILARELGLRGLYVQRQVALPVLWSESSTGSSNEPSSP